MYSVSCSTMQSEQCACIKSPIHVFNLENWLFSIVVSLKKVTSKFLLQENDVGYMKIKHFSIQRKDDFWSDKGIIGPAVHPAFTSLPGGWLETTFFIEKPLIKAVNFLRKKYGNIGYFCSDMGSYGSSRRFNGSVNISDSCDFRSQFDPLYIIL